ncbi:hypothetical protein MtrunA17_Chr2g0276981 [Medicago truncatula]|uniref:Uncharacterized protein n=1 Tax=Medicago truncatula TaxID=3880 RepID=A0A396J3Q5_MEDTR|nr:hypothetical protein MtrunA17_Chr2g0276981 [Medicago truncatula]
MTIEEVSKIYNVIRGIEVNVSSRCMVEDEKRTNCNDQRRKSRLKAKESLV